MPWLPIDFMNVSQLFSTHIPDYKEEEKCDEPDYCQQTIRPITNSKCYVLSKIFPVPVYLTTVIYRQCQLRFEIPEFNVTENSLEYADLSFNLFISWMGPMLYLDLSNNVCSNDSKVFFKSVSNLQTLNIQNNLLDSSFPMMLMVKYCSILNYYKRLIWQKIEFLDYIQIFLNTIRS